MRPCKNCDYEIEWDPGYSEWYHVPSSSEWAYTKNPCTGAEPAPKEAR